MPQQILSRTQIVTGLEATFSVASVRLILRTLTLPSRMSQDIMLSY
jgi:hypothetical protein